MPSSFSLTQATCSCLPLKPHIMKPRGRVQFNVELHLTSRNACSCSRVLPWQILSASHIVQLCEQNNGILPTHFLGFKSWLLKRIIRAVFNHYTCTPSALLALFLLHTTHSTFTISLPISTASANFITSSDFSSPSEE